MQIPFHECCLKLALLQKYHARGFEAIDYSTNIIDILEIFQEYSVLLVTTGKLRKQPKILGYCRRYIRDRGYKVVDFSLFAITDSLLEVELFNRSFAIIKEYYQGEFSYLYSTSIRQLRYSIYFSQRETVLTISRDSRLV